MKYVVILADGMADENLEELGGKTPLDYAFTPNIEKMAPFSEIGIAHTIPEGCPKGSDTANLSVLGYDPEKYYFGRSPLEALSIGVELKDEDVTFRANLVTLSEHEPYDTKKILDHSADEITTEEADILIKAVATELGDQYQSFYTGISYRHLLVWDNGSTKVTLTPPHDILGQSIEQYKPSGDNSEQIWNMMKKSYEILNEHPINKERVKKGLKPANSLWIWGEGTKPTLPAFELKYGIKGAVISAVDLIKGIGIAAGMQSIDVEGATGTLHTNYQGKAKAAIKWLIDEDKDFVYIHLEGPDECGHRGELDNKIKSIEWIDEKVIGPVTEALKETGERYRIMILPDHPTPIKLRTHTGEGVPYMIYDSIHDELGDNEKSYTETYAKKTQRAILDGYQLMDYFVKK